MLVITDKNDGRIASASYPASEFLAKAVWHYVYGVDSSTYGKAYAISNTQIKVNRTIANTNALIMYGLK